MNHKENQLSTTISLTWSDAHTPDFRTGEGNLPPSGQMRPAWTFDMARIKIFVTQFRIQNRVKTKLHD